MKRLGTTLPFAATHKEPVEETPQPAILSPVRMKDALTSRLTPKMEMVDRWISKQTRPNHWPVEPTYSFKEEISHFWQVGLWAEKVAALWIVLGRKIFAARQIG